MLCMSLVCCERGEHRRWRERANDEKQLARSDARSMSWRFFPGLPSCVGQGLLKCDGRLPTITSLASCRPCVSKPKRRHWRASVGSGSSNSRAERDFCFFCFVLFVVVWWRAVDGVCALLGAVCAARRCVRGWVLCAWLGAVCARRYVCAARALLSSFCIRRETRMYFFPLQIWLVVVTAQVTINAADAEA